MNTFLLSRTKMQLESDCGIGSHPWAPYEQVDVAFRLFNGRLVNPPEQYRVLINPWVAPRCGGRVRIDKFYSINEEPKVFSV